MKNPILKYSKKKNYKKYFETKDKLRKFWKENYLPIDVLENNLNILANPYKKAKEKGYNLKYVLKIIPKNLLKKIGVTQKEFTLSLNFEEISNIEDRVLIEHAGKNLSDKALEYLIKLKEKKC